MGTIARLDRFQARSIWEMPVKRWVGRLKALGYKVEWKNLNAADYGAPTHRRRLFLIARCDGAPIVWPEATHGDPKKIADTPLFDRLQPWRTAAECIDWDLPCPSIFDRKRPLAEATMRRIALGIKRYVLENPQPFIVGVGGRMGQTPAAAADQPSNTITAKNDRALVVPHLVSVAHTTTTGRGKYQDPVDEPLKTVTQSNDKAVVAPYLVPITHTQCVDRKPPSVEAPLPSITTAKRGEMAIIAPCLMRYNSEKSEGDTRTQSPTDPLSTIDTQNRFAVVGPCLVPMTHANRPVDVVEPMPTVTTQTDRCLLVAPTLIQTGYGERDGQEPRVPGLDKPLGTVVSGGAKHAVVAATLIEAAHGSDGRWGDGTKNIEAPLGVVHAGGKNHALVSAFLAKHFGGVVGVPIDTPTGTVTTVDHHSLVAANLVHLNHGDKQWSDVDDPLRTVTATGRHAALVYSFLVRYFGTAIGQHVAEPLFTITGKDRFGLITVSIDGEPYVIADIGMRMLTPRELARAQGFPDEYKLTGTKTSQVARIGNSVPPIMSEVLVKANFSESIEAGV